MDNHYPYKRGQVIYILKNSGFFSLGLVPPSYKETGYIGKSSTKGFHAPFENPVMLWAELSLRISHTNQDGYYLSQVYSSENQLVEMDRIARAFQIDINEVSSRVEKALKYVTGVCRRWKKCNDCKVKNCPKRGKKKAYEYKSWRY
ncbi:MAG: hypothetical protein ABH870_02145 [bacterium]